MSFVAKHREVFVSGVRRCTREGVIQMDDTYRVTAIWEISSEGGFGGGGQGYFRRSSGQTQTFDFAPFFSDACEEVESEAKRPVKRAPMMMSPMMRLQRA